MKAKDMNKPKTLIAAENALKAKAAELIAAKEALKAFEAEHAVALCAVWQAKTEADSTLPQCRIV